MVQPVSQGNGSLGGTGVSLGISPLPEAGLDEAFGLPIGPRSIGFGAQVPDAQLPTGALEVSGDVGVAVVGHDTLHADAEPAVVLYSALEELSDRTGALVGSDFRPCQARGVVDSHRDDPPADTAMVGLAAAIARDAMSNALDSPEFLHIQVQK